MARTPSAEYLVLDLETIPDDQRWTRPDSPDGGSPFPPTWAHRIIVIGCLWLDHGYGFAGMEVLPAGSSDSADEREGTLLASLADRIGNRRPVVVTFNGRSFDLPVIALRSLCHGVPQRWYYREQSTRYRYSELGHIDVCDWLADHGAVRSGSLDALARLIGLPGKIGVDGSQVEGLVRAGQLAAVEQYCLSDVAQTALLFLRFRLVQGVLAPADYRARVEELLAGLAIDSRTRDVLAAVDRPHLLRS